MVSSTSRVPMLLKSGSTNGIEDSKRQDQRWSGAVLRIKIERFQGQGRRKQEAKSLK